MVFMMRYLQNIISTGFGILFIRIASLTNIQSKADETQGDAVVKAASKFAWEVLITAVQFIIE